MGLANSGEEPVTFSSAVAAVFSLAVSEMLAITHTPYHSWNSAGRQVFADSRRGQNPNVVVVFLIEQVKVG
jgi:hypothetical protein